MGHTHSICFRSQSVSPQDSIIPEARSPGSWMQHLVLVVGEGVSTRQHLGHGGTRSRRAPGLCLLSPLLKRLDFKISRIIKKKIQNIFFLKHFLQEFMSVIRDLLVFSYSSLQPSLQSSWFFYFQTSQNKWFIPTFSFLPHLFSFPTFYQKAGGWKESNTVSSVSGSWHVPLVRTLNPHSVGCQVSSTEPT